jgi:hypothetical protein
MQKRFVRNIGKALKLRRKQPNNIKNPLRLLTINSKTATIHITSQQKRFAIRAGLRYNTTGFFD